MGCKYPITDFTDIQYACNTAFGGIVGIKLEGKGEGDAKSTIVQIEFNTSDAFSNASETKTVSPEGTVAVAQTLQVELPRLDAVKYKAIESFKNPNFELKVHILTKAGVMITYGAVYGCFLSTADVASGSGRQDKNRIQLTFTGDEAELAPVVDAGKAAFDALAITPAPSSLNAEPMMAEQKEVAAPKKRRIIEIEED